MRENVTISALERWTRVLGIIQRKREAAGARGILASLGVTADPSLPITALSGGNQQRALAGRLVASEVGVVLLDDPTIGVDLRAREALWSTVRDLAEDRVVVVASSDPEELAALCDRVVVLKDGEVAEVLSGENLSVEGITHAMT